MEINIGIRGSTLKLVPDLLSRAVTVSPCGREREE
jgi:hypothetical protein